MRFSTITTHCWIASLQSSWLLLLVVPPVLTEEFAREHDRSLWRCVSAESWESVKVSARTLLAQHQPFLLFWAASASEVLCGQGQVPSGRVGRIVSPWFSRGTLMWWLTSWISWRGSQKLNISDAPPSQLEAWMGSKGSKSLLGEH